MKTLSRLLLIMAAALFLYGCAITPPTTGMAALSGTWTNSLGTVWTMRADGSYDVDLNKDGKTDVTGTCTAEGNTLTCTGTGKALPKRCDNTKGSYHFTRSANTLHFTVIKDPCELRRKNVTSDWTKK